MRIKLACLVAGSTPIVVSRIGAWAKCASSYGISSPVILGKFWLYAETFKIDVPDSIGTRVLLLEVFKLKAKAEEP